MPITFAQVLERVRKESNLTQQGILELLIESAPTLAKLDLTTYSRWERGVTIPKLSKQLLVARIMGGDVAELIKPVAKKTIKITRNLEKLRTDTFTPYGSSSFKTSHYESLISEPKLCQQLITFHRDYLEMDINLNDLHCKNLMLETFVDDNGQLIGHLLYGFIETSSLASQFVPHKLSDYQFVLPKDHKKNALTMYVISGYSSLAPARMTTILMVLDMLRKNTNIKNLHTNCYLQEAYLLHESNPDSEIIYKGKALPFGGVKVYGKYYRYVCIKVRVESLLASKVISDLVPFTQEYIEYFLGNTSI